MDQTPYEWIGGDAEVRALVDRFYDAMDSRPDAQTIRAMHPPDLTVAREKLYLFLSGWMGGPQLYIQQYGHPRLRRRHLPFPIDTVAAEAWMACMNQALEGVPDAALRDQLSRSLTRVAGHMRNQE